MAERTYIAIDLKSFYASVECVERNLDPLVTNLVVADESRTQKTICLAVSPSLKQLGIPGRARLFEVVAKVKEHNALRKHNNHGTLEGSSCNANELISHPEYSLDFVIAKPRMALYIKYSTQIYQIYLKYIAPEDMHVYSIDEVFLDATQYLKLYNLTAHELAKKIICDIQATTGITATAGIGTNLYLCKIALDIGAKHTKPDKDGVRIATLDEMSYRKKLWNHTPLTDFWRVGKGYSDKLVHYGIFTMGDVAECSVTNENLLYSLFGINAELLIDHAWGYEPVTIADIKSYKPQSNSISCGQVLQAPYSFEKGKLVCCEMAEGLALDLLKKQLVTNQIVLTVGYDVENQNYQGEFTVDRYGRKIPKHAHGTQNLKRYTSSAKQIVAAVKQLFDRCVNKDLLVRRMYVVANNVIYENSTPNSPQFEQMSLFDDTEQEKQQQQAEEKEKKVQKTVLKIKEKYGKNAILKGSDLQEGATAKERNDQIGGHKA